jgi:hypothetical protein
MRSGTVRLGGALIWIIAAILFIANDVLDAFTVTPGQHDFGEVFIGDTASFSFIVTNTGNDTNSFSAEMSGIGQGLTLDTDQSPYQWQVAPGDSEFVAVLFHPSSTGYRHRILVVRWSIFFAFNDVSGTGVPAPELPVPQDLTIRYMGNDQVLLQWAPDSNAYYRIYAADSVDGLYDRLVGSTSTHVFITALQVGDLQQFYLVRGATSAR